MNQPLRDRIMRRLESLSDERLYQVLDYVEFLESKYAARQAPSANVFQRFAETIEDRLRAGRVSTATIAETMTLMNKAMGVLSGVAAAGKSVANDLVGATGRPAGAPSSDSAPVAPSRPPQPEPPPEPPPAPPPSSPTAPVQQASAPPAPPPSAPPATAPPPSTSGESTS